MVYGFFEEEGDKIEVRGDGAGGKVFSPPDGEEKRAGKIRGNLRVSGLDSAKAGKRSRGGFESGSRPGYAAAGGPDKVNRGNSRYNKSGVSETSETYGSPQVSETETSNADSGAAEEVMPSAYKKVSPGYSSARGQRDNSVSDSSAFPPDKIKAVPPTYKDKNENGIYYRNFYLGYDGYMYLKIPIYKTKQIVQIGLSDLWGSAPVELVIKRNKVPTKKELESAASKFTNIGTTLQDGDVWYTKVHISAGMNIPGFSRTDRGYGLHPLYHPGGIKRYKNFYLDSSLLKPGDVLYILAHSLMGEDCYVTPGSAGACYALCVYYLAYLCEDKDCLSLSADSNPGPGQYTPTYK